MNFRPQLSDIVRFLIRNYWQVCMWGCCSLLAALSHIAHCWRVYWLFTHLWASEDNAHISNVFYFCYFYFLMIELSFSFFSCCFLASMPDSWLDRKSVGNVEIRHFSNLTILWVSEGVVVKHSLLLITVCKGVETGFFMMGTQLLILMAPFQNPDSCLDQPLLEK